MRQIDQHPLKQNHIELLSKLYQSYFNHAHLDAKTFIQQVIDTLGSFLSASVYLYEHEEKNVYDYLHKSRQKLELDDLQTMFDAFKNGDSIKHLYPITSNHDVNHLLYINSKEDLDEHQMFISAIIDIISSVIKQRTLQTEVMTLKAENEALNQTKQQFLANMSHEMKTPLSGVYQALYLLSSTELTNEQKEYHQLGTEAIEQLSNILDDLLDIKKMTSGQVEIYQDTFNLEDEMIRVIKMHQPYAKEKKIDMKFHYDYAINHECVGDFRKLRQIVSNLIHNGIKFTSSGYVSLSVEHDLSDEKKILFIIEDTGIGMDEASAKHMFDVFYQADQKDTRAYQGTGLGLPIVYQLTNLLKGDIKVESTPNQGTHIMISIPLEKGRTFDYQDIKKSSVLFMDANSNLEQKMFQALGLKIFDPKTVKHEKVDYIVYTQTDHEQALVDNHKKQYGKPHVLSLLFDGISEKLSIFDFIFEKPTPLSMVYQRLMIKKNQMMQEKQYSKLLHAYALIVDDNRLNRVALSNVLKKLGLKSKQADSGKAAIELVKKESFDCILMDIQMPEMDGIEATRRIRSLGDKYQKIPIIAVTANAFLKDYDVMKTAQITDVIFKPINVDHLEQVLRKYISYSTDIFIPPDLFVFDQQDFNHRFEGSYAIGNEVLKTFLTEYPKDMKRIHEAIQQQDFKMIEHETHYFKGSCAYLSAKRVVWVLTYMVEHARLSHMTEINDAYPFLINEIERLIEEIKEYKL